MKLSITLPEAQEGRKTGRFGKKWGDIKSRLALWLRRKGHAAMLQDREWLACRWMDVANLIDP